MEENKKRKKKKRTDICNWGDGSVLWVAVLTVKLGRREEPPHLISSTQHNTSHPLLLPQSSIPSSFTSSTPPHTHTLYLSYHHFQFSFTFSLYWRSNFIIQQQQVAMDGDSSWSSRLSAASKRYNFVLQSRSGSLILDLIPPLSFFVSTILQWLTLFMPMIPKQHPTK